MVVANCLRYYSIAVKKHHTQGNSDKRSHLMGTYSFRALVHNHHGGKQTWMDFWNLQAYPQWYISFNRAMPPNLSQTITLPGDQAFKHVSLWNCSHSNHHLDICKLVASSWMALVSQNGVSHGGIFNTIFINGRIWLCLNRKANRSCLSSSYKQSVVFKEFLKVPFMERGISL